jgi:PKD repeat protein
MRQTSSLYGSNTAGRCKMKKHILFILSLCLIISVVQAQSQFNLTNGSSIITVFNGTAGSSTISIPANVSQIELLVVAGGGSGGSNHGGGGGAGGLSYASSLAVLPGGTYNLYIGGGGAASGNNGTASFFSNATYNISVTGGGGGGNGNANARPAGGSGGGAGASPDSHVNQTPGANVSGQGFYGGGALWFQNYVGAGGGGGAGSQGGNNTGTNLVNGGNGGSGAWYIISGTGTYYACGGGGGSYSGTPGWGGCNTSAAGDGGKNNVAGIAGRANTGSGGGGGAAYSAAGGAGSAGIIIVSYSYPVTLAASFTDLPDPSNIDQSVTFTDTSAGTPTIWLWNFNDGNTSTLQNPTHAFPTAGDYTILFNISNATGGWSNTSGLHTVSAGAATTPLAMFTKNYWLVLFPRPIQFNDTSTNTPTAWNWSFGDGKYSDSQSPSHQYVKRGRWTVALNASNAAGYNINTSTIWILGG